MTRKLASQNQCQISSSCALVRKFLLTFATCSLKQRKTSREDLLREDIDLCSRKTLTQEGMISSKKPRITRVRANQIIHMVIIRLMEMVVRINLKISIQMKSLRTLRAKRRT